MKNSSEISAQLAEPFPVNQVHWRVGNTSGNRGKVLAYIDARDVMDRLDAVVGPQGWSDTYSETPTGRILCSLTVFYPEEDRYVTKTDGAGSTGFEGEKGGISDAFKRAAVKFGIGRYLYGIDTGWIDLDVREANGKTYKNIPKSFDGSRYLPGPKPPTISDKQLADLEAKIDEVSADRVKFLEYFGVHKLSEMPAEKYHTAISKLEKKANAT